MRIMARTSSGRLSLIRSSIVATVSLFGSLFGAAFGIMPSGETVRSPPYCPDNLHPAGRFDARGWCNAEPSFEGTMVQIDTRGRAVVGDHAAAAEQA